MRQLRQSGVTSNRSFRGTREAREPGIHLPRLAARSWIPGSAAFALRAQVAAPE
jgi:hypothetical protein